LRRFNSFPQLFSSFRRLPRMRTLWSHGSSVLLFLTMFISLFSCDQRDSVVIDSPGFSPFLEQAFIVPALINSDTVNVGTAPKPDDTLPLNVKAYAIVRSVGNPVSQIAVRARLLKEFGSQPITAIELRDDGLGADSTKGDGTFSGILRFSIKRSDVGIYRVECFAEGGGFVSNTIIQPLKIVRQNRPPVLSDLQAPDTVRISTQSSFLITVRASDPDGLEDVQSVTRTTPSGLVVQLNDRGVNGDAVAGDGIFSERVSLSPPPAPGSYQFRFQAFDRSNAGSNVLFHMITVVQ
jgi:hypothetical protein